ncbi:MAG: hypothetical protein ACF787_01605 [Rhodopirellula sp. JB053]
MAGPSLGMGRPGGVDGPSVANNTGVRVDFDGDPKWLGRVEKGRCGATPVHDGQTVGPND